MGKGFSLRCRYCGYHYSAILGIGFVFPETYEKTIREAKNGDYGGYMRRFLMDHPDGALNCDQVLLQCGSCGKLDQGMDLSMYVPVSEAEKGDPWRENGYVVPWDLQENYQLFDRFPHICRKCNKVMKIHTEEDLQSLCGYRYMRNPKAVNLIKCPDCGKVMEVVHDSKWD